MPSELHVLREAWLALEEPSEDVRAEARTKLFEEIVIEQSERFRPPRKQKHAQSRVRARVALLVVLVLLLLFAWATLTFAFGWRVVVFGQAKSAPHGSRVFKLSDTMDIGAPPGMASGVIANQTRKVATFGKTQLWVAPTAEGGFCDLWIGGSAGGGCERLGVMPLVASYGSSGRAGDGSQADPGAGLREINGSIKARWSNSVEIRFEDGTVIRPRLVWVSAPIEAGFFYQEIPRTHRRVGHQLREVVALDGDGNVIYSENPFTRSDSENGPPAGTVLDQAEDLLSIETPAGNVVQRSAPTRYDGRCSWLELRGRTYASSCLPEGYRREGPRGELIRLGNAVLFYAIVSDRSSVRLQFADGDQTDLHPSPGSNGLIVFKLDRGHLAEDARLTEFAVLNASGKQILSWPVGKARELDR